MHFAFDEDQELLRSTTRRFLEDHDVHGALRPLLEAERAFDASVWRDGAQLGWSALLIPPAHGGGSITEQPLVDLAAVAEELGRVLFPGPFLPTNVVADAVARFAASELQQTTLPPIASGAAVAAWCHTADGGAEIEAVDVRVRNGSGRANTLDGGAGHVQDAHEADLLLVTARGAGGPLLALVPRTAAGVDVRVLRGLDLTRRHCAVRFDGVRFEDHDVVARDGDAVAAIERALNVATIIKTAESVGAADALFASTLSYAKDRIQFGRPIGSFQAIKHRLADLLIELEAMRAAVQYAAMATADGRADATEAVHVAGSYVPEAFAHLSGEALQLHGGIGFTWEHDVHLFVRRARSDRALYGDPTWHREQLCRLLGDATKAG